LKRGRRIEYIVGVIVLLTACWIAFDHLLLAKSRIRWLINSPSYKSSVIAEPVSANSTFKHIEWDGWGWAGQDTNVYLIFDPTDSFSNASGKEQPGALTGLPCAVWRVERLEPKWYYVVFFTNTTWNAC
jgi:hypothetical protein